MMLLVTHRLNNVLLVNLLCELVCKVIYIIFNALNCGDVSVLELVCRFLPFMVEVDHCVLKPNILL